MNTIQLYSKKLYLKYEEKFKELLENKRKGDYLNKYDFHIAYDMLLGKCYAARHSYDNPLSEEILKTIKILKDIVQEKWIYSQYGVSKEEREKGMLEFYMASSFHDTLYMVLTGHDNKYEEVREKEMEGKQKSKKNKFTA